ncbi:MAG TPA: hypothetical protein VJV78_01695 [Polyangiales bacterium]|nr:hypothetical protein [Polyangiales bacterium]
MRTRDRIAAVGVLPIGLIGAYVFATQVGKGYPIELWLFWKMLKLWGWTLLFNLACASFGQFLIWRVLKLRALPALESAAMAMPTGVVALAMFMYAAGALGLYRPWFAVLLAVAMTVVGARDALRLAKEIWSEWHVPEGRSVLQGTLAAIGAVCVGIIYLGVLSPDVLNYDATWSHQVIAQEYARLGRMVPFIADYNRNVPHLASLIYTWDHLIPTTRAAERWMLALHAEFSLFIWTLVAVNAALRMILNDQGLRRGWVCFFLFPIIFVYDSTLGGASDHVCGFFSVPIALAALRCSERFERGFAALLAIQCAGAVLTKLQAMFLVVPATLVLGACWLWQLVPLLRHRKREAEETRALRDLLWAPVLIGGLGLLLFSPHAVRQYVFHNNPLYPFMQDVFKASVPTVPDAAYLVANNLADPLYQPQGTFFEKLLHAAELFGTFSFVPHYSFTRDVPAFGSLFTLLFPCLVFVRNRRLLLTAAIGAGAVLVWGMVYNVDRNLQAFMPVLVCTTGALIVTLWRLGWIARLGLIPLIAVQIVWGGDALFYSQQDRLDKGMDLIRSGYEGRAHKRFHDFRRSYLDLTKAIPEKARVLLHGSHISLGLMRETLLDIAGVQGLIHYNHLTNVRQLYDYYRRFGITHLVDEPRGSPSSTAQEEVLWDIFSAGYAVPLATFDDKRLFRMPDQPPPESPGYRVATIDVDSYHNGIYAIQKLNTIRFLPEHVRRYAEPDQPMPKDTQTWPEWIKQADAVIVSVHQDVLDQPTKSVLRREYNVVRSLRRDFVIHARNTLVPNPAQ